MSATQTKPTTISNSKIYRLYTEMCRDNIISESPIPQELYQRMLKISPVWAHQLRHRINLQLHVKTGKTIVSKFFEPPESLRKKYSNDDKEVPSVITYTDTKSCFLGEAHGWTYCYDKPNGRTCVTCQLLGSSLRYTFNGDYRMLELFCAHWEEVHQE